MDRLASDPNRSEPPRSKGGTVLVIAALSALVLCPLLVYGGKTEANKWQIARAHESYANGDTGSAIQRLTEALESLPPNRRQEAVLIDWLIEDDQSERALARCRENLKRDESDVAFRRLEVDCLYDLGKHRDALRHLKALRRATDDPSIGDPLRLENWLAFLRASAGVELFLAEKQVIEIVRTEESNIQKIFHLNLPLRNLAVVLSALVANSSDDRKQRTNAIEQLTVLIDEHLDDTSVQQSEAKQAIYEQLIRGLPIFPEFRKALKRNRPLLSQDTEAYHAALAIRALLYESIGMPNRSYADRIEIESWGKNADTILAELPDEITCLHILAEVRAFLHTRAYVAHRLQKNHQAAADFDAVIYASETLLHHIEKIPEMHEFNVLNRRMPSPLVDPRLVVKQKWRYQYILAVFLFHRMSVNQAFGDEEAVERDRQRRRSLGFEMGEAEF